MSSVSAPGVQLAFNDINHFVSGAHSATQQFQVQPNKDFRVNIMTNAAPFTLFGQQLSYNADGNIANSFNNYTSSSNTHKDLLLKCKNGGDNTFSISYQASHGPAYPAGDYTVGVICTPTQP